MMTGARMDDKNARVEMKLKAKSGFKSGVAADISPAQWQALNAIVDGDVDPHAVLALRKPA